MTGKEFHICFMFVYGVNWYTPDQTQNPSLPRKYAMRTKYSYPTAMNHSMYFSRWVSSDTSASPQHFTSTRWGRIHPVAPQWGSQRQHASFPTTASCLMRAEHLASLHSHNSEVGEDEETDSEARNNSSKVIQAVFISSSLWVLNYMLCVIKFQIHAKEKNIGQNI